MGNNIVSLDRIRAERQYKEFHTSTVLNLALDTVCKPNQRDYAKELQVGYMKLLSKQR